MGSWKTTYTAPEAVLGESDMQEEQGNGCSLAPSPSHYTTAWHKPLTKHQVLYRTGKLGLGKCIVWPRTHIKSLVTLDKKPGPIVCVPPSPVLCCQMSLRECGRVNPRALHKGPGPPYPGTRSCDRPLLYSTSGRATIHSPSCAGQAIIKAESPDHLVSPVRSMAMNAFSQLR